MKWIFIMFIFIPTVCSIRKRMSDSSEGLSDEEVTPEPYVQTGKFELFHEDGLLPKIIKKLFHCAMEIYGFIRRGFEPLITYLGGHKHMRIWDKVHKHLFHAHEHYD
ncbi:uncharacterized protein LOC113370761 [Ctenocephalides felis]|uniref:uncharacterized protein LOC113370761 n=1 Tax=Ctenocephalides felis TaxID=7515 RepID=UPI000E6E3847|nr:uncharacterized protein LOC113370761 [Ctenocephalides felis]